MIKSLLLILVIFFSHLSFSQAQLCREVFELRNESSFLASYPELQQSLDLVLENPLFPVVLKQKLRTVLERKDVDLVVVTRQQARKIDFPDDGVAFFLAKKSQNRFRPFLELFKGDYTPPSGLSQKTLKALERDPEKHFIVIVDPITPSVNLRLASQVSSLIHEMSHLIFAETLAANPSMIKSLFPQLKYVFRFGDWTLHGRRVDYLDEMFANFVEYKAAGAVGRGFNVNWYRVGFKIDGPHRDPGPFIGEWVRHSYEVPSRTTSIFDFSNFDVFYETMLSGGL